MDPGRLLRGLLVPWHASAFRAVVMMGLAISAVAWAWHAIGKTAGDTHLDGPDPVRVEMVVQVMAGEGWRIAEQSTAPGVLVLTVQVDGAARSHDVAREIIRQTNQSYDEVLMYLHRGPTLTAPALERIQWVRSHGYSRLLFRDAFGHARSR